MAKRLKSEFQTKSDILRNLVTELMCHNCKAVPSPFANGSNRYQCEDHAQYLCEDCKTQSVCKTVSRPSPGIAKLINDLPWFCCNFTNGCKEIMWEKYLKEHQQNCKFRLVTCPQIGCKKRIIFKDVKDHVTHNCVDHTEHLNYYWYDKNNAKVHGPPTFFRNVVQKNFLLTSFCARPNGQNPMLFMWVYFCGSPCEAKNYSIEISPKYSSEYVLRFSAFAIGEDPLEIWKNHPELSFSEDVMKKLANKETHSFELHCTVKNVKEEAKDEDGDSGCND